MGNLIIDKNKDLVLQHEDTSDDEQKEFCEPLALKIIHITPAVS
jgi:hypothetical protein